MTSYTKLAQNLIPRFSEWKFVSTGLTSNPPKTMGGNPIKKSKEKMYSCQNRKEDLSFKQHCINPFHVLIMSYSWACALVVLWIWRSPGTQYIFAFPEMYQKKHH